MTLAALALVTVHATAQIGEHRNVVSIGVNGGYAMSNVGFTPKVNQKMYGGMTGGVTFRYVCEKYFNTVCALQAEVNYTQAGWKEDILDLNDQPVITNIRFGFSILSYFVFTYIHSMTTLSPEGFLSTK